MTELMLVLKLMLSCRLDVVFLLATRRVTFSVLFIGGLQALLPNL